MAITNKIGAPVTGSDFYGRTQEIFRAHRYLDEGQSLLLSAPRRIGKSSLAKKLLSEKVAQNWKCVYIDLQGVATKEAFLRKLIASFTGVGLIEKTGKRMKEFLDSFFSFTDGIELGALKIDLNHKHSEELLYQRLAETFDYGHDTLIVIDELTLFLGRLIGKNKENRDKIEFLLNWFRSIRQNDKSKLRWIFCGSVGLRNFTAHYHMSHAINDLVDFELGELPRNEGVGLIRALAQSYGLSVKDEIIDHALDLLQWYIPYFIQLLIDRLIGYKFSSENKLIQKEDIQKALDELSRSAYFMTWDERLEEYGDLETLARTMLNNLSVIGDGLSKEKLLQIAMEGVTTTSEPEVRNNLSKLLGMLERDGYIMRNEGIWKFRSPLLQKWWKYKA